MKNITFIGIAGGTASGKTTLAELLAKKLGPKRATVIALDAYYKSLSHLSKEQRELSNFDHPEIIDADLLVEQLEALRIGNSISLPTYDYVNSARADVVIETQPTSVVIIEGILTLHYEKLLPFFSLKIFVETTPELRLSRRLTRDIAERGRTHDSVMKKWIEHVVPMHDQFCQPTSTRADIIIDGSKPFDKTTIDILQIIERDRK